MYQIQYNQDAVEDLKSFRKSDQQRILEGIEQQLRYEPTIETRNRKLMRANEFAEWELRLGGFRVLYNVEEEVSIVDIQRVAEKRGNAFFLRGIQEDLS
jgi:mRNA-degrading endonuclease RelE of RelBE toxin-antitoxin system